jgi:hypothetical protein
MITPSCLLSLIAYIGAPIANDDVDDDEADLDSEDEQEYVLATFLCKQANA